MSRLPNSTLWLLRVVASIILLGDLDAIFAGMQDEKPQQNSANAEFFETHVRPIFAARCYACHSNEKGTDHGELILESVAGIAAGGSRGLLFSENETSKSLLLHSLSYLDVDLQMPPEGKLPASELKVIETWITNGADLPEYQQEPRAATHAIDWEAGRTFWSFQPLHSVTVPTLKNSRGTIHPIDAFVMSSLQSAGLEPSPEADRRTLIRRLSFDLVGLPPTPDTADAFENDPAKDAFEKQVDHLLAQPQYGERWARVWLDLARYTDSTPDWQNPTDRGWMYRDWVVDAFNSNRRYDEFVRLQLAADLQPKSNPQDLAALGFLGLSPTYWKELQLAPSVIEQIVADEWDERIDAVSRTFLGLTVACARCHDHKFDPISTEDYYALAGIFASTQLDERPLLPAAEANQILATKKRLRELQDQQKSSQGKSAVDAASIQKEIDELKAANPGIDLPLAHVLREASVFVQPDGADRTRLEYREGVARDLPVFRRGNPSNPGPIVPRRYPTVLQPGEPQAYANGSGRRELAEQMFSDSQGLIARVIVNRIWAQHFGEGLVRTPSDFGAQGDRPTHPELLEYLAFEFVNHGWNIKWLHRLIVTSATWRQSSRFREDAFEIEPENQRLWRFNRRRLDFEMWRDAILAVNGQLDLSRGGPSKAIDDPTNVRRSLYVTVAREELHPTLRMHDFPEASSHSPRREPTTTPLQQLFFLNSPWMKHQATALAGQLPTDQTIHHRIDVAYRLLFTRSAADAELTAGLDFIAGTDGDSTTEKERWAEYLQSLMSLNEFHFVE
ncbi:MAG: DUF1549 and DUF1553 domain-containing protein [Planctomycetota bacterium]